MSWLIVSNAFEKSRKRPQVTNFLSIAFLSESVISKLTCSVKYPFLNPNWYLNKMLYFQESCMAGYKLT